MLSHCTCREHSMSLCVPAANSSLVCMQFNTRAHMHRHTRSRISKHVATRPTFTTKGYARKSRPFVSLFLLLPLQSFVCCVRVPVSTEELEYAAFPKPTLKAIRAELNVLPRGRCFFALSARTHANGRNFNPFFRKSRRHTFC